MAFFGDFDAPWLARPEYSRYSNPYSHAFEDMYRPRQRQHGYSGEPFGQIWPDLSFSPQPQHAAPRQRERQHAYPERGPYVHNEAEFEALQRRNWLLAQLERDRQEQAARRHENFPSGNYRGHRPGPAHQMHHSQSPEHWSAAEFFGMPPSRPSSWPVPGHTHAASPAVYSIHSFHDNDDANDNDSNDDNDEDKEDQDMQPAPLELERDRLQQLKKRQQLHDLQLRQQHLREQQQQALQEQRRREALIERELRSQREAQRRRAEEHRLEQQQQEALLAALQQQRRQQEQRLRQQEKRRTQQQQAEQQAELAHRMQQLWQSHLEQEQRKAGQASSAEAEGPQAGGLDNALDQLFKRRQAQQAQQAQRAQQDKQPEQHQQRALHAQQQEVEESAQHAFEQPAQHPHQLRFDPLAQHEQHASAPAPYQRIFKQPAQQAQHAQPPPQRTFKQQAQPAAMPGQALKAKRGRLTPDEAVRNIQRHYQGYRIRSEKPILKQLAKANHKLAQIFARLYQVEGCMTALLAAAQGKLKGGAAVRLKHHHGKCGSPEQLQKQLLELSELSMQVVLSMDELHSERAEVRAVRKQVVKKALALMERIDNVKAGMLRSLLDITHPHDQLESRASQLESRPSQLESRASQLGTPPGQLESRPSQLNNASPAASHTQGHTFPDQLSSEEQPASTAVQGLDAPAEQDRVGDAPSDSTIAQAESSSPPAGLAGAALPGQQGPLDVQPGIEPSSPGTKGIPNKQQAIGPSHSKQDGDVAQQAADAPSSQQSHQAVLDAEKGDIYSVASAFAGAATPAQTDGEHKELQDREDEVEEEVTRHILTALQQQGRRLVPGAFENTQARTTHSSPEEDIDGKVEDAVENMSEHAAAWNLSRDR